MKILSIFIFLPFSLFPASGEGKPQNDVKSKTEIASGELADNVNFIPVSHSVGALYYDNYNWDKGKDVPVPLPTVLRWIVKQAVGTTGSIRIQERQLIVEDEALARLHRQELAKEFEINGQEIIYVEGTVGAAPSSVSRGGIGI